MPVPNSKQLQGKPRGLAPRVEINGSPYYWRIRAVIPERCGQPCRVTARGRLPGPRNLGVEFPDGFWCVTAWSSVRRRKA